jgi:two-component system response regulator AtoC
LIAGNQTDVRNYLVVAARTQGYSAETADDSDQAFEMVRHKDPRYAAVVLDFNERHVVRRTLRQVRSVQPSVPVIVLGDSLTGVTETELTESGAAAVLWKPLNHEDLRRVLDVPVRPSDTMGSAVETPAAGVPRVAGGSWWSRIEPHLRNIGASDVPVLVQGETGVGKEVLARQVHAFSARARKMFLKVNCAALPTELVESELFGYERGAFTGAFKNNPGKFELAQGGTILLDEIGDMDFKLQAKLLQVLQDGEFIRLGATEPRRVDVRVIAATHCDLERAIDEGRFREDLYYRLNILTLRIPPLRERRDDIIDLAQHMLQKHATANEPMVEISRQLRDALLAHDWPGNVRELENLMRKLLVLRRCDIVVDDLRNRTRTRSSFAARTKAVAETTENTPLLRPVREERETAEAAAAGAGSRWSAPANELPAPIAMREVNRGTTAIMGSTPRHAAPAEPPATRSILDSVDAARRQAETEAIVQALNSTLWNRKRAAQLLNIDYKALLYKMKKLGIGESSAVAV